MTWESVRRVLAESFRTWWQDRPFRTAGALAYDSIFAFGPILMIVLGLAGLLFGERAARGEIPGGSVRPTEQQGRLSSSSAGCITLP
jgi:membrane protein